MANAGRVEVNIAAVGEDKLTAMFDSVNRSANETKASINGMASAGTSGSGAVGALTAKLHGAIKPFDEVRGRVNALRENVMFFGGALLGFGASLAGMVASLQSEAWAKFSADLKGIAATLKKTADLLYEVDVLLGKQREKNAFETAMAKLLTQSEELTAQIDNGKRAISESESQLAVLARAGLGWTGAYQEAQEGLIKSADTLRGLELDRESIGLRMADLMREQERSAEAQAKAFARIGLKAVGASVAAPAPAPRRGGGGGGGRRRGASESLPGAQILSTDEDVMAQIAEGASRKREDSFASVNMAAREGLNISDAFGKALDDAIAGGLRRVRDEALEAASAIISVSEALTGSMTAAFPDVGAGLGELVGVMQRYREETERLDVVVKKSGESTETQQKATENLTGAIISGGTAVAASVAKTLGGLRAEYVVRSAGEFAAGVASSFTNPAEAATHFSASVLYGIAAAKAGGGGGGGGGGSKGGGGSSAPRTANGQVQSSGGSSTTIFQFSTMVTDRSQVRRAVGSVMARRDRSGYSQRGGA